MDAVALVVGMLFGIVVWMIAKPGIDHAITMIKGKPNITRQLVTGLAVVTALMFVTAVSFAQSGTLDLVIPVDTVISETNNWLDTFAPIAAIGIGITLALAILGYLGKMISSAFRG